MRPTTTEIPPAVRLFLPVALAAGVLFVFLTPPFHVPDEPAHFFRAYAVSEGTAFTLDANGNPGAVLPASLPALARAFLGPRAEERRRHIDPAEVIRQLGTPLQPERRVFVPVPPIRKPSPVSFSAVAYLPTLYVPEAAVIGAGRLARLSPLVLLYLARLANLLAGVFLLWIGLRWAPYGHAAALALALFPMSVVLRSSSSTDAILLPLAFAFVAGVLRGHSHDLRFAAIAALAAAAFVISAARAPYAVLALLVLLLPSRGSRARTWTTKSLVLACAAGGVAASLGWMRSLPQLAVPEGLTINSSLRLQQALASPLDFVSKMWHHMLETGPEYAREIVGNLGWLDHPLPIPLVTVIACGTVLLAVVDGPPVEQLGGAPRAWIILVCAGTVTGLVFVLHLGTPFEAGFLTGFQGRYVIPAVWPLLMAFGLGSRQRSERRAWPLGLAIAITALSFVGAFWTTIGYYAH